MFTLPDEMQLPARSEAKEMDPVLVKLDMLVEQSKSIMLDGPEGLTEAELFLKRVEAAIELIDGLSERFREPAFVYYKSVMDEKKRQLKGPEEAKELIRQSIREYLIENDAESEGFHVRDNWKVKLVDLEQLVHMVANGEAPLELLQLNTKFANETAKVLKGDMSYDGIKSTNEQVLHKTNARKTGS